MGTSSRSQLLLLHVLEDGVRVSHHAFDGSRLRRRFEDGEIQSEIQETSIARPQPCFESRSSVRVQVFQFL